MEALHKIRKGIDTVLSSACVLLFAMMVVVGTYQIVTRFIFNKPHENEFLSRQASGRKEKSA